MDSDDQSEQAQKIKDWAKRYAEKKGIQLNPDEQRVDEVAKGLAIRQKKFGKRYCPCRIITGDTKEDRKIICPCVYQEEELKKFGTCHCKLFSVKESEEGASSESEG
ncbi:MAG: ferredoxin-thioredoxin reductase catalytic domain-containing protein [Halobacteriota archaeon]